MRYRRILLVAALAVGGFAVWAFYAGRPADNSLAYRVSLIRHVINESEADCRTIKTLQPLVLLALGQSNAGNHGARSRDTSAAVALIADDKCILATDPLPGATGSGGSIWSRLPRQLKAQGIETRPVVMSVIAVDAATIDDWISPTSPLPEMLKSRVAHMKRLGLPPDFVLWQQGEADGRKNTTEQHYFDGLMQLGSLLDLTGTQAPVLLAYSTVCGSDPHMPIRQAIERVIAADSRFRLGPDTDTLAGPINRDGCHLTTTGLESAARMWASAIIKETLLLRGSRPVAERHPLSM